MRPLRVTTSALGVMLLCVSGAFAQSPAVFNTLGVDLWPDYDRPGVLVVYRATIAPEVSLPARLVFRIPAAVGLPSAAAERTADGPLMTLPFERTVDGETALIILTASQPFVQLEYYDLAIARDGAKRRFAFVWLGGFEIRNFSISLQQPHLATNFTTVPDASTGQTSVDGLVYHMLSRTGVKAAETVVVQASYEKASDQLSVATIAPVTAPPPTPATGNAATSDSSTTVIVLVAIFAGAAAVVVGVVGLTRRRAGSARRPPRAPRTAGSGPSDGKAARFCTQCGAGVGGGDRFCQRCGATVKA